MVLLAANFKVGAFTVTSQEAETPFAVAVIEAVPVFPGVSLPSSFTDTMFSSEECQVTKQPGVTVAVSWAGKSDSKGSAKISYGLV